MRTRVVLIREFAAVYEVSYIRVGPGGLEREVTGHYARRDDAERAACELAAARGADIEYGEPS